MLLQQIPPHKKLLVLSAVVGLSAIFAILLIFGKIIKNNFFIASIPKEKKVNLMVEKKVYLKGEEVRFSLINESPEKIFYVAGESDCSTWPYEIYRFFDNKWSKVLTHIPVCGISKNASNPFYDELFPNNFKAFIWNQNHWDPELKNYTVKSGIYKLSMRYGDESSANASDNIIYSSVFTVIEDPRINSKLEK